MTVEGITSEVAQDIQEHLQAIEVLKQDLVITGLSDHALYAIANQISWNEGQISYLGSVMIDLELQSE